MAIILHIESATRFCSVAISRDGLVLASQSSDATYQHAQMLTTLIDQCQKSSGIALSDLEAVSVSDGPGSFTALRVGMSTAKGICFGLKIPLIGVPTLQSLAQQLKNTLEGQVIPQEVMLCPMIDARRMEVYTNLFDWDLNPLIEDTAMIIKASAFQEYFEEGKTLFFTGDGCEKCQAVITHERAIFKPMENSATAMVPFADRAFEAGQFLDLVYAEPHYLKAPNITKPKKLL